MTEEFDNERLERLLREEEPYVASEGFSQNVIESLPKRRRLSWRVKRRIVKGVSVLLGVGAVVGVGLSNGIPNQVSNALANPLLIAVSIIGLFVAIGGTCVWVMSDRA